MKTNLMGLAVAAAFVTSFSAFAQDCERPAEVAYTQPQGHYVTQNVQQWVPGHYEQVYVPFCRGRGIRCHGGRTETRWVAGYSTTVQQSVWVADAPRTFGPMPYGEYQYRHPPRLQARTGFQLRVH